MQALILRSVPKCESAGVGQPLNLRPACIAKLFKFSCFGIGYAWLKFRAPSWHFSHFGTDRSIQKSIDMKGGNLLNQRDDLW
jgi:hypothetical protein